MVKEIKDTLRIIGMSFEIELRQNLTDGFVLFGIVIQPLIVAFMALWMLKDKGPDYAIFVVVGSAMTGLWTTLLFNGGNSITSERWSGTLDFLVGAPSSLRIVVFGKGCYTLISLAMGYPLTLSRPIFFLISIFLTVFAFVGFGVIIASLFILIPDFQRLQNTLEFPIYILCGFLFPIALLPGWTTPISYILSPYWAARSLHGSARGTLEINQIFISWALLIIFSVVYIIGSSALYRLVLRRARVDATLNTTG
jgi:ABC-2 type transport system permease protein